jgi:hypothetical protein
MQPEVGGHHRGLVALQFFEERMSAGNIGFFVRHELAVNDAIGIVFYELWQQQGISPWLRQSSLLDHCRTFPKSPISISNFVLISK